VTLLPHFIADTSLVSRCEFLVDQLRITPTSAQAFRVRLRSLVEQTEAVLTSASLKLSNKTTFYTISMGAWTDGQEKPNACEKGSHSHVLVTFTRCHVDDLPDNCCTH
jgi:hypothetical protein